MALSAKESAIFIFAARRGVAEDCSVEWVALQTAIFYEQ